MSISTIDASASRALSESALETEFATPYALVSQNLRPQPAKVRAEVVELIQESFHLHQFDAETLARSAADLAQLRDAIRSARKRRYGQLEIEYIEFDVVSWRILPSLENVRFEGDRAWNPTTAARYSSLGVGQPVLTIEASDPAALLHNLKVQTNQIWRTNPHSRSIPMRGIENSGLLSIARLKLGAAPAIGILEATDGFSRTVGAQRGSGISAEEVLGLFQLDGPENKFRTELITLRDDGSADLDSELGRIAAARLRSSAMPRAQVIVGYKWLDETPDSQRENGFDGARRQLVGHIHLEPPLRFTDSTQFALKARVALTALKEAGQLPVPTGFTSDEIIAMFLDGRLPDPDIDRDGDPLRSDEILLLAVDAIRAGGWEERAGTVNRAIYALTGKKPNRADRTVIAVDTAMRTNRLLSGEGVADADFTGRRSTIGRALAQQSFSTSKLSRRLPNDLLELALDDLRKSVSENGATRDSKVSAAAAELGGLALYALVEGVEEPLIVRAGSKALDGTYLPEPPEIMNKLMTTEGGLNQLAQAVYDGRARRRIKLVPFGEMARDDLNQNWDSLHPDHLIAFVRGNNYSSGDELADPHARLDSLLDQIRTRIQDLRDVVRAASDTTATTGQPILKTEGAAMNAEYTTLNEVAFVLRTWSEIEQRLIDEAHAAQDLDTEFSDADWTPEDA
jgi:hypothetical protein